MSRSRLFAALVPAGLAVFALGCRGATPTESAATAATAATTAAIAATPVPAPSEEPAAPTETRPTRPRSTRRPGPVAPATAWPTATGTPRPTPTSAPPGPLPVEMTLEEAEQEVRSWWIPELQARIVRSAYVRKADVRAALAPDEEYLYFYGESQMEVIGAEHIVDPLIMVEVVQPGLEKLVAERFRPPPDRRRACLPPTDDGRYTTFFEAQGGWELGHHFEPVPDALWSQIAASPVAVVHVTATPRPSPSPSLEAGVTLPTRTTHPPPAIWTREPPRDLEVGEVPAPLGDTARTLPWVVGGSWSYRVTAVLNMTSWTSGTFSERIVKAMRLGPDVVEVQFERSEALVPLRSSYNINPWRSGWSNTDRAVVVPTGAVVMLWESMDQDDFRAKVAAIGERRAAWTRGDPGEILRLPLQPPERYNYWWRVLGEGFVGTPAGDFPVAYALSDIVNAGNSWTHWLAPGVGFVRHELPGIGTSYCSFTVLELTDYRVPAWVEVP